MCFRKRDYLTERAVSMTKYLISKGVDPKDAIEITISKYIYNPKFNIDKLVKTVEKEIKHEITWYEEEDFEDDSNL